MEHCGINAKLPLLIFNKKYFSITALIFLIEVLIAVFVRDSFVRPYLGDVLIVILLYCSLKSFLNVSVFTAAIAILLFSFFIEFLQYILIIELLNVQHSTVARTVIGTSFSWLDLLAYTVGIAIVLALEKYLQRNHRTHGILRG